MNAINIFASSRRISRSELPLDQPTAIVATNSRMGNNFLHSMQMIDLLRENLGWFMRRLWKKKSIDAFMVVT